MQGLRTDHGSRPLLLSQDSMVGLHTRRRFSNARTLAGPILSVPLRPFCFFPCSVSHSIPHPCCRRTLCAAAIRVCEPACQASLRGPGWMSGGRMLRTEVARLGEVPISGFRACSLVRLTGHRHCAQGQGATGGHWPTLSRRPQPARAQVNTVLPNSESAALCRGLEVACIPPKRWDSVTDC